MAGREEPGGGGGSQSGLVSGAEALALLHMTTKRSHPWEG